MPYPCTCVASATYPMIMSPGETYKMVVHRESTQNRDPAEVLRRTKMRKGIQSMKRSRNQQQTRIHLHTCIRDSKGNSPRERLVLEPFPYSTSLVPLNA